MLSLKRLTMVCCIAGTLAVSQFGPDAAQANSLKTEEQKKFAFTGDDKFQKVLSKAEAEHWPKLPIGELMGRIATQLEGTPYVANTLELSADSEVCSVNLAGLDCVTFFESTLDLARMLKKGGHSQEDLLKEVNYTRYRGGTLGDYTTRLHYTSDWLVDNEKKGVVKILDQLPGAKTLPLRVNVMSTYPESSRQLKAHPELVKIIQEQERTINGYSLKFIPLSKIAAIEPLLQTGDIVGVCTDRPGIEITHTGLIYKDEAGVAHFMDASSKKSAMKVIMESGPISRSLNWSKHLTGAIFARPLEPR